MARRQSSRNLLDVRAQGIFQNISYSVVLRCARAGMDTGEPMDESADDVEDGSEADEGAEAEEEDLPIE